MKVTFQRGFFIEGYFFHPHRVEEVPDRFHDQLPADADVIEGGAAKPPAKPAAKSAAKSAAKTTGRKVVQTKAGSEEPATRKKPAPRRKKQPARASGTSESGTKADPAPDAASAPASPRRTSDTAAATPVKKAGAS